MADEDAQRIREASDQLRRLGDPELVAGLSEAERDELLELVTTALRAIAPTGDASPSQRSSNDSQGRAKYPEGGRDTSEYPFRDEADFPLTTTRAAALIGVSRPFLIKLLNEGAIPFHKVGRDRRIQMSDVQTYLAKREQAKRDFRRAAVSGSSSPGRS